MKEFDLELNKWLTDIFDMRYDWIPAYYRDEPHFDYCMEIQRHNSRKNDHDTRYTHSELQNVLDAKSKIWSAVETKRVLIKKYGEDRVDSIVSCCCKRFEQYGFPKKYILDRWKRDAGVNIRTTPISNLGNEKNLKVKKISREITLAGEYLINSYVTDIDELTKVRDQMNIMIQKTNGTRYQRSSLSKRDIFAEVLGYEQPSEVTVLVPSGIRNKGRGSHKRIKSQKEIAIARSGKKHRECKVCNLSGHNSRTCPGLLKKNSLNLI
ncbi:uncharacterized protein LOC143568092 [Bidens hawaiensis]|uniref:uncharacterized protein LOC143568092 n=1 Tax=Bidens hawaiensis TaxID=980011 RepID=UPI00404B4102